MKQTQTNYQSAELRLPPAVVCGLNGGHQIKILPSICQFSPNAKGCASDNAEIRAALLQQLEQWNGRDAQGDCGLSARKFGSLIAQKLGSLSAHKPGHSKRRRVVYIYYIYYIKYIIYIYIFQN